MEQKQHSHKRKVDTSLFIIPISIIIAGGLIAWALFARGNTSKTAVRGSDLISLYDVAAISSVDHIRGYKDAKIVFIEYSDLECPFCKDYHESMKKILAEYSQNNQVAWVYRHFPLSFGEKPLHPQAAKEAEATECAYELGGEDSFWKLTDAIYATTKSNNGLDMSTLPTLAESANVDKTKFKTCLDNGKYTAKIKEAFEAGSKAGARGTPYTVIRFNGQDIPMVDAQGNSLGALPYDILKKVVEKILSQK